MNWKQLKNLQIERMLDLTPKDRAWDDIKSNPIDDIKTALEILSKHEPFYIKSIKWLYGSKKGGRT